MTILHAKTILAIIPRIDEYCDMIAKANHARAIGSFYASGDSPYGLQDTYQLMERIIEKTYKAQQLHNLKVKFEKQLETAPEKVKEVIRLFFLKGEKPVQIAKSMGKSERTIFRQIESGVEWVAGNLEKMGINSLTFRRLVSNYGWIRSEFENQSKT